MMKKKSLISKTQNVLEVILLQNLKIVIFERREYFML